MRILAIVAMLLLAAWVENPEDDTLPRLSEAESIEVMTGYEVSSWVRDDVVVTLNAVKGGSK